VARRARYGPAAPGPCPRRASGCASSQSSDRRAGHDRRNPSTPDVLQSLASGVGQLSRDARLRQELPVHYLRRIVLLQRRKAPTGTEQTATTGRRIGQDVRRRHEVLGGGKIIALPLVGLADRAGGGRDHGLVVGPHQPRSEEHTSELQSRFDLVCRLLLEKKKHFKDRAESATGRPSNPYSVRIHY